MGKGNGERVMGKGNGEGLVRIHYGVAQKATFRVVSWIGLEIEPKAIRITRNNTNALPSRQW